MSWSSSGQIDFPNKILAFHFILLLFPQRDLDIWTSFDSFEFGGNIAGRVKEKMQGKMGIEVENSSGGIKSGGQEGLDSYTGCASCSKPGV